MEPVARLERRVRNPWPMRGRERRIYLLTGMCIASGLAAGAVTGQWHWFSRSGSLIVVLGIYFAWLDLSGTVNHVRSWKNTQIQQILEQHQVGSPTGLLARAQSDDRNSAIAENARSMDRLLNSLIRRIQAVEAGIIAAGTLIWGYGDVFMSSALKSAG